MNNFAIVLLNLFLFVFTFFVLPCRVLALGGYLTGDYGQVAPVEVRAIIDFDGKTETIVSSQTFIFNPLTVTNFYWVFALPKKIKVEEVEIKKYLKNDPFLELEKKTVKRFSKDNFLQKILFPDIAEEKFEPAQTFSRDAYIKYLRPVPDFKNADVLERWFRENAFPLPKISKNIFGNYLKKNWRFVIANIDGSHLEMDAKDSLTINGARTIPIEIKFATDKIIYPLSLVRLQPDRDSKTAPLSFTYGSKSENILGVKDSIVDNLLSSPASNLHSPLLLDLMPVKIDLLIKADYKVAIGSKSESGFTTIYADKTGNKYLTRLVAYKPLTQLEDLIFTKAKDNQRVNPDISITEKMIRFFVLVFAVFLTLRSLRFFRH